MRNAWSLPGLLGLLAAACVLATPAVGSLFGLDLFAERAPGLAALAESRSSRLLTGWSACAVVAFQFLHSVRMRTGRTFGIDYPVWIALHQFSGILFLAAVLVHTGGRWGAHLNGWLTLAALAAVFGGIAGKVTEFLLMTRIILGRLSGIADRRRPADRRARARSGRERRVRQEDAPAPALYRVRTAWTAVHLAVATLLVVTLAAHVASVWYF